MNLEKSPKFYLLGNTEILKIEESREKWTKLQILYTIHTYTERKREEKEEIGCSKLSEGKDGLSILAGEESNIETLPESVAKCNSISFH